MLVCPGAPPVLLLLLLLVVLVPLLPTTLHTVAVGQVHAEAQKEAGDQDYQ